MSRTESKQGKRWLPFDPTKHSQLRNDLRAHSGLYAFYNSEGEIIYFGKTQKRNLYNEIVTAFNRAIRAYSMLKVAHPWNRYKPSDGGTRQIRRLNIHLHDTARYFSCYRVQADLIGALEALIIRVIPNDLINVKMQKLAKKQVSKR